MAITPVIIAPSIRGHSIGNNIVGDFAFAHGGAFYAFLYQGGRASIDGTDTFGDLKIHAFKSVDSGATWTEQNAGGAITPQICAGFGAPAYTAAVDGNTVYVLSLRIHAVEPGGAGIDGITVTSFNLTSGVWGTSVNYSTPLPGPWTNSGSAMVILQLVVRGAGDYLLYFSGPLQAGYGRVYYAPFNGTTFGASVMLPGQSGNSINYSASGAVCGTNGITQFIYFREGPNVYSVALNSSGSFGSVQTVSTASTRWGTNWSMPRLYTQGGTESALLFGWIDDNNDPAFTQSLRGYHAPVVLNPTWTETYICLATDDTDRFTGPFFTATHAPCDQTFTISGTRAVAIWAVTKQLTESPETTIGEFWYCEADTATFTWTAPAVLFRSGFPGVQPFPGDPTRDAYLSAATQVVSFDGGSGAIGVIGCSLDQALAQAAESGLLPGTATGPTVGCGSPPGGTVGTPYSHAMTNTHTGAFTVEVTAGALPDGLTMDASGLITGTPTVGGSFTYTATITDSTSGGLRSTRSFTPVTIGSSIQGYDISDNVCGSYAFAHGGAQYAFLRGGGLSTPEGDQKIHAFKSTDSGATWTELGAGIPNPAVGGFGSAYAVEASGTTAYVITARVTRTGPDNDFNGIGVTTFNLTTGAWGATTNHSTPKVTVWHGDPPGGSRRPSVQLVVLGPGSYLLFYGGPFEVLSGGSYGRVYCATFDGGTFGAEVMLPGQAGNLHSYTAIGAVAGSGGIVQLLFLDGNNNTLYSVGRQSSGTFGTVQAITNDGYFPNFADFSPPCLYQAGAVESIGVLGWINSATPAELHVFHAPMALNPVWQDSFTCAVVDDTSGSPPTSPTYAVVPAQFVNFAKCFSLSASGNAIWALWTTTAPSGGGTASRIWYCQADTATLTWTAPAMLVESAYQGTAPFLKPVASQVISWSGDGLGVIVLTQDYNSLAEAAESVFIPAGGGGTGSVTCTITISAPTIGLGCASPPDGVVGVPYLHAFPVSGGVPPLTFAITSGILPPGLTLDSSNGEVSGTPTLAGDFPFTIQVSDGFGSTVGTCDIVITVTDLPASGIGCGSPPGGEIGVSYSHTFPVTDIPSGATVAYSITGGALPPGLTLNTSTGQVTGTPTTSGNYHFTVTATIT